MQVRYQAAPRPDRKLNDKSAAENPQYFFELEAHLPHDLLALADVRASLFTAELVARTADGEALLIEQAADLADDDHILALVVTAVFSPRYGVWRRKIPLPLTPPRRVDAAPPRD